MKIFLILVVWGDEYLNLLFEISFPSQLALGNLPYLSNHANIQYLIYTTKEDETKIKNNNAFNQIRKFADIYFKNFELKPNTNKYILMTACHNHAIQKAGNAPLFFLGPDIIFSQRTFECIYNKILEGKRAVIVSGIRLQKESFLPLFQKLNEFSYSPRDLVRVALQTLHRWSKGAFWTEEQINECPSHLYWKLGNHGILIRAFHQHPLMIWPKQKIYSETTIDGSFLKHVCTAHEKWHLVQNSDEFVVFEISPEEIPQRKMLKKEINTIAAWANESASPIHLEFFKKPVIFHTGDDLSQYVHILEESDATIHSILNLHKKTRPNAKIKTKEMITKIKSAIKKLLPFEKHKIPIKESDSFLKNALQRVSTK